MPARSKAKAGAGWRLFIVGAGLLAGLCLGSQLLAAGSDRPGMPDASYPDLTGEPRNLRQWQGKVVLLNFWASWCSPCLAEIRHLTDYQRSFASAGLQVIGLGLDEPRKLNNVARSLQINYPILVADPKQSRGLLKAWGNKTGMIPYTVIFDATGHVVQAHRGILDAEHFDALVKPLLSPTAE